ncbi:MAG: hypothetical protein IT326_10265 [Anaerolineae bacterium]|nr:hypothetical protein [Anaerolineae bacterium]
MNLGFLIRRSTFYRPLGPVIDRALAVGDQVKLFLVEEKAVGRKAYQVPTVESVPGFRHGVPEITTFRTAADLEAGLRERSVQALICLDGYHGEDIGSAHRAGAKMVMLPQSFDLLSIDYKRQLVFGSDFAATPTPYLNDLYVRLYTEVGGAYGPPEGVSEMEYLREFLNPTGWSKLDQFGLVDPVEVRQRLGIPPEKRVVLVTGHVHAPNLFPWDDIVMRAPHWPRDIRKVLRYPGLLPQVLKGPLYHRILRALREFCDREDALLIVKYRLKDIPDPVESEVADLYTDDLSYYPHTTTELLAIADLFVSFMSTTCMEAAFGHVPSITLIPDHPLSLTRYSEYDRWFWRAGAYGAPHGAFEFPGVCYAVTAEHAVETFRNSRIADFPLDPAQRLRYLEHWCGPDDFNHSARVLDLIHSKIEG